MVVVHRLDCIFNVHKVSMCYLLKLLVLTFLYEMQIEICKDKKLFLSPLYIRLINMEFLEGGLLKLMSDIHFKSGALRKITNIARSTTF